MTACKAKAPRRREAMMARKMAVPMTNLPAEERGTFGGFGVEVGARVEVSWTGG
jgi:hypothetical protein